MDLDYMINKVRLRKKKRWWLSSHYYREYINSIYRREKREQKLKLKPICECCWVKSQCVHHQTYHRLWKERMGDLKSLCNNCHTKIHFTFNEWNNSKKSLSLAFNELREILWVYPYWNPK